MAADPLTKHIRDSETLRGVVCRGEIDLSVTEREWDKREETPRP